MAHEDQECVVRILAGESQFFEDLVRRYTRFGGAIAYGVLGDFQHAEDVVQEAFFKAYRSLASLNDPAKFRAWFGGIVRSLAIDVLRKQRVRKELEGGDQLADFPTAESANAESPIEQRETQKELRSKVLSSIDELPGDDRLVIVLKHMSGLSYKEIAEVTGMSVSAIESRLFRARQALKKKLHRIR